MAGDPLAAERTAAIEAVEEIPHARAWAWERDSIAGSYYSEEECERQAGTSDAIVLILEDELTRITRAEYTAAHAGGATVIVLIRSGVELNSKLSEFIAGARRDAITKEFSDLAELRSQIGEALWHWFLRAARTAALDLRQRRSRSGELVLAQEIEIADEDGRVASIPEFLEEARRNVEQGQPEQALERLYYLAAVAIDDGQITLGKHLLRELADQIPVDVIDQTWRGWILNLQGQLDSAQRSHKSARANFEQMRQIGVAIGDQNLEAIAHQNLGIQEVVSDNDGAAREHFQASLRIKRDLGDGYGGIQVLLNLVNVLMAEAKLDEADQLLKELHSVLARSPFADLRSTLHAHRGVLATKHKDYDCAKEHFLKSLKDARGTGASSREIDALQNLGSNAAEREKDREALRWYRKALELARASEDKHCEQVQLAAMGARYARLEEWEPAVDCFSESARVAGELSDASAQAEALGNAGASLSRVGRPEQALALIENVLADPGAEGDPDWRARQLSNLAEVLEDLNQPTQALSRLEEAANLAPDPDQKETALRRAAEIALAHPGLAVRAPDFLHEAFDIRKPLVTSEEWAWQAAMFGALLSESSQSFRAAEFFSIALRVFSRNGDHRRAFFTRNDRAIAHGRSDELSAAARDLRSCIQIAEDLSDRRLEFQARMNLGEIERRRGQLSSAETLQGKALKLARKAKNRADEAAALNMFGLLRIDQDQAQKAGVAYKEALAIGREIGDRVPQQAALGGLAGIAFRAGRYGEAEKRYKQALRLHDTTASTALVEDLGGLVMSEAARGKVSEETLQRLIDVSGVLGWDRHCASELGWAAWALSENGNDFSEAVSMLASAVTCAARELLIHELDSQFADRAMRTLAEVAMLGVVWMYKDKHYAKWKAQLVSDVRTFLELDEDLGLLSDAIEAAEEALS